MSPKTGSPYRVITIIRGTHIQLQSITHILKRYIFIDHTLKNIIVAAIHVFLFPVTVFRDSYQQIKYLPGRHY
jgi:hypothetical protein